MQLHILAVTISHFGNFLPGFNQLLLPDQNFSVVGIGTQIVIIVFNDDQIAVSPKCVTVVNHFTISRGNHAGACRRADVYPFVAIFPIGKTGDNLAPGRPYPAVDLVAVGCASRGSGCRFCLLFIFVWMFTLTLLIAVLIFVVGFLIIVFCNRLRLFRRVGCARCLGFGRGRTGDFFSRV